MAIPKSNDPLAVHQEPPYLVLLFPEQAGRDLQQRHQFLAHALQVVHGPPLRQIDINRSCSKGTNWLLTGISFAYNGARPMNRLDSNLYGDS